jgi:hypothetical protein
MKRKVIATKNQPTTLPLTQTACVYLLMDHFHASNLIQGIVWTLFALLWIGAIILICNEEHVEIFRQ